tara:strand:- start:2878 stop:3789 length:912 start_codon:yes stop_codon:yes gene_type:complete
MALNNKNRVVVLKGGPSEERAVSLVSGSQCGAALSSAGYDVIELDVNKDVVTNLKELEPDVVFNALHGRWGEDGCIQGILEWLRIPYTHSGVMASAMAMDKERTKSIYRYLGLPCAESVVISSTQLATKDFISRPYVIKPINEGSSIGIHFVHNQGDDRILDYPYDGNVMLEEFIPGRELTVTVFDDIPLTVTEIITDRWYDYDAKYSKNGSNHVVPANIPKEIFAACKKFARIAHKGLGCRGLTRTDFRWDEKNGIAGLKLLETNTQPGMTPTSLAPEQARLCGISFIELCRKLIEDSSCNR